MRTVEYQVGHSLGGGRHVEAGEVAELDDREAARKVAMGYAKYADGKKKSGPVPTAAGKVENRDPKGA